MPNKDYPNEPELKKKGEQEPEGKSESSSGGDLVDISEIMSSIRRPSRYRDAGISTYSALLESVQNNQRYNMGWIDRELSSRRQWDSVMGLSRSVAESINGIESIASKFGQFNREIVSNNFDRMNRILQEDALNRVLSFNKTLSDQARDAGASLLADQISRSKSLSELAYMNVSSAIIDYIDPVQRNYSSMYCKQKKVSVKVSHDSKQIMSAQYDRMAVIELLKAVLLYEKLNPDFEIELSGELLEPNTLFTCWKKHTSHKARYEGQSLATEKGSTLKKEVCLWEWLEDVKQQGVISEEELDWAEFEARRAELFIRRSFGRVLHFALLLLERAAIQSIEDNPIDHEEYRSLIIRCMSDSLRDELPRPDTGRGIGTGLFSSIEDFETALFDVFTMYKSKPTQAQVIEKIRQHPLCQRKESDASIVNQTATLRGWLKKTKYKYFDNAWDQYCSLNRTRK